ncbi:MAG: hypothetical protein FIB01_07865 [Gemmatimonadetes bacterium]|nr:hypothetical protein [Gemmatimonadota bacterium]
MLTRSPTCLLADAPFRGSAPSDTELLKAALRARAATGGAAVATGHETSTLLATADDVIWLVAGTTHYLGTPAAAARSDHFCRDYLVTAAAAPAAGAAIAAGPVAPNPTSAAPDHPAGR